MPRLLRTDGLTITLADGRRVRLLRNNDGTANIFVRGVGTPETVKRVPTAPSSRCAVVARYLKLMVSEIPRPLRNELVSFDAAEGAIEAASTRLVAAPAPSGPLGLSRTAKGTGFEMMHGNAFVFVGELPEASFDAIILDPPYGTTKGSGAPGCYRRNWDVM